HRFFPLFWEGSRERVDADGRWIAVEDHFFLFPFYGFERTTTRVHHYLLFPLFHLQKSSQSLSAEFWPLVFYRDRPGLQALRFWPLHASESGEDAGDFWVSKYLFLSKFFRNERETSYRLDPFLFRTRVTPDEFEIAGLFEALAYETSPTETSFRAIPFAFGKATEDSAITAVIPLHYRKDHGTKPIDYYSPWRLFFLTSSLKGAGGERHFSVFTKLFDITDNPERPDYLEIRFLHQLFFYYRSETAKQVEFNPFFQYYRDDTEQRTVFSIFFSLYRQETVRGQTRRTLFFFIPF
ncbi:MAG: hypothetical protein O7J95_00480, partial [Planctomycetota bacterium]|nr:hypothetical protein [Planctomycetota bacterium]